VYVVIFITAATNCTSVPYSCCNFLTGEGSGNNYAYLVIDDKTKDATIIDPANPPEVLPVLKKHVDSGAINLKSIINTHQ